MDSAGASSMHGSNRRRCPFQAASSSGAGMGPSDSVVAAATTRHRFTGSGRVGVGTGAGAGAPASGTAEEGLARACRWASARPVKGDRGAAVRNWRKAWAESCGRFSARNARPR